MRIGPAATDADFRAVEGLMQQMRRLDERLSAEHGVAAGQVAVFYEGRSARALAALYRGPGAAMMVARDDQGIAGCGGLTDEGDGTGELHHVFLEDRCRGQGIGAAILQALLDEGQRRGLREIRLETASFLTAALAMYRRAGFTDCPPFRPVPEGLEALSVFMRRAV